MAVQIKIPKNLTALNEEKDCNKEHIETTPSTISNNLNAPKHGTVIPNRIFVGGIAPATTELDLIHLFSNYGNVTGTKIISDRAGVSKGYGFVTFETEDEAKRLQKDAENIVLGQRRLNIAPAIKKQGFGRGNYDCTTGSPIPPTQVYRHNGITYTFHNGMAFFPQPSQVPPSSHVEPSPVFQSGTSYGAVTPSSPGPAYPFSYAPQGQIFYQAPQYQYHIPQYDGCYEGGQVMVADGSLVIPQYYLAAPQPAPELTYYQPTTVHPQETSVPSVQQVIYASPRAYDSALVYSTEPKCALENGMGSHNGGGMAVVNKEEGDPPVTNNHRRTRESTPVVSLLKLYKGKEDQGRRKQHHQQDDGRRQLHLNNNNPDTTNRNLKQQEPRRGTPPSVPPYPPSHASPNLRHPPVQVPQFPYYHPRQILAPSAALTSFYPPPPPPARPRSYYRPRYGGGRGGGRGGGSSSKWLTKEEELGQPLTPPITPRSEPAGVTGTGAGPEDVVQSIQALAI